MPSRIRSPQGPRDIDRLARKGMVRYRLGAPCTPTRPWIFPHGDVHGGFCCESADHQHDRADDDDRNSGCSTGFTGAVRVTSARQRAPGWYTAQAVAELCVMADTDETLIPRWTWADRGRAKRTSSPFSQPGRIPPRP